MNPLELLRLALSRLRDEPAPGRADDARRDHRRGLGRRPRRRRPGHDRRASRRGSRSLGTNLLTISPSGGPSATRTLTLDDAAAIARSTASPPSRRSSRRRSGRRRRDEHDDHLGRRHERRLRPVRPTTSGRARFLTDAAVDHGAAGRRPRRDDRERPRPRRRRRSAPTIRIGGLPFEVIGILQPKGGAGFNNPDDQVLVPAGRGPASTSSAATRVRTIGVSVADRRPDDGGDDRDHGRSFATATSSPRPTPRTSSLQPDPAARRRVVDQRDAHPAARRDRLDLADRRRHRDHEHHAGLGPRADPRDRHPQGRRRPRPRHPRPVPHRGPDAVAPRRPDRHRRRLRRVRPDRPDRRLGLPASTRRPSPRPSCSASPSASCSASGPPDRPPGSTRSRPSATSRSPNP